MSSDDAAAGGPRIRTMEEFASAVGISRPTVSRFFNDPRSVRPASRARIEAAMLRLGYRPNLFALNFNRRNPKTLGILVPSLLDPFYAGLVEGIEKLALEAGYWTIVLNALGEPAQEAQAVTTLTSLNLAGAIVIPLGDRSEPRAFRHLGKVMPIVFLDTRVDAGGPFVGTDNDQGIGLMVDYLLRSGSPPRHARGQSERPRTTARLSADDDRPRHGAAGDRGREPQPGLRARGVREEPTAFCAGTDERRHHPVRQRPHRLRGRGRRHPKQPHHRPDPWQPAARRPSPQPICLPPPLTTVAQDRERLASVGLAIVLSAIGTGTVGETPHALEARLIMRASA